MTASCARCWDDSRHSRNAARTIRSASSIALCPVSKTLADNPKSFANLQSEVNNSKAVDKVCFIDFQKNVFVILGSLDLVIVPSTEPESFGLIVVEAMLAKKAVIGSNIGGISTIIDAGETGLLFEPNNKDELAAAITQMIEKSDVKEKIEAKAYQKAMDMYSTNSMYQKFKKLYNTMI